MASIRQLHRADDSTAYQILWRDPASRKQTSFTTDSEAEAWTIKQLLDANGQSFELANQAMLEVKSQSPTLDAIMTEYLTEMTGVELGTKAKYVSIYDRHIKPVLGGTKSEFLTRAKLVSWFDGLDLAPKTKKNVHALLSSTLTWAVGRKLVDENNAKGISVPRGATKFTGATFLTVGEFGLLDTQMDSRFQLFTRTLVNSGARFGELTAALKSDFEPQDSGHYVLNINKAWKRTPYGPRVGTPKTTTSVRHITLPLKLSDALSEQLKGLRSSDLAFTNTLGEHLASGTFYRGYWKPALDRAGEGLSGKKLLKVPRVHDLRHTHASWLIAAGVPLPVIQARLGHTSIQTTVDIYGHLTSDADLRAADAIG